MEAPPLHFNPEQYFSLKTRDGRLSGCGCIHVSIFFFFLSPPPIENSLSVQVSIQLAAVTA